METRTTGAGIHLIKRFERFEANWYRCPAGAWTIGWGTTEGLFSDVTRDQLPGPIDAATGDALLRHSLLQIFEPALGRMVGDVPLRRHQFDALVSFTYNVGAANFRRSTLREEIIRQNFDAAAAEFSEWIWAGGRIRKGLIKRREAERLLFENMPTRALEVRPEPLPPMDVQHAGIELPRLEQLRGHIPVATQSDADEVTR